MYLIDTSIWAEILLGTPLGDKALEIIKKNECFALDITLAELSKWRISQNFSTDGIESLIDLSSNGILNCSIKGLIRSGALWNTANNTSKGRQVGLMDCIIAACAEEHGFTVLTKDRHFSRFESIRAEII